MITDHKLFVLINVYFPNAGQGVHRALFKMDFYECILAKCRELLSAGRSVVLLGDVNTAHRPIDLWKEEVRDWSTVDYRGCLDSEADDRSIEIGQRRARLNMDICLKNDNGSTRCWLRDLWTHYDTSTATSHACTHGGTQSPTLVASTMAGALVCRSIRFNSRSLNAYSMQSADYAFVSSDLADRILQADVIASQTGSDHAPISLVLDLAVERVSTSEPRLASTNRLAVAHVRATKCFILLSSVVLTRRPDLSLS
mgnify:FL=1